MKFHTRNTTNYEDHILTLNIESGSLQYLSLTKKKVIEPTNREREMLELNNAMNQMDLTDFCRTVHVNTKQYTCFSAAHGTYSKTDYILCQKASKNR